MNLPALERKREIILVRIDLSSYLGLSPPIREIIIPSDGEGPFHPVTHHINFFHSIHICSDKESNSGSISGHVECCVDPVMVWNESTTEWRLCVLSGLHFRVTFIDGNGN